MIKQSNEATLENLTHINKKNNPTMVDVSQKDKSSRVAVASGRITMSKEAYCAVINSSVKKGPVIQTAIVAGIMGAKNTSNLIPMCHPLLLSGIDIESNQDDDTCSFTLSATVKCEGKTGVEMEALTAVSVALLTIYDMVKAIDKGMVISDIGLCSKSGGKSGDFKREIV